MTDNTLRSVTVERAGTGHFTATNARGGAISFGTGSDHHGSTDFSDELGNRLTDLVVTFSVAFPDGEPGDRARAILPRAVKTSHDRLCTVSRTVEIGTPVTATVTNA
jgi:hypothetical protein